MPDIKIGDNTLTGVSELQCVNADDTTQHVVFYSAPRAILAVTAPAGSTIDVLQNSIVLQTYTLGTAETSHSFKVDVSTTNYVVRATLLDKVKNKTVAVTAATTYNITIEYSILPAGYTELEYIQSASTQYINTGIKFYPSGFRAKIKLQATASVGKQASSVVGGYLGPSTVSGDHGRLYFGGPYSNTVNYGIVAVYKDTGASGIPFLLNTEYEFDFSCLTGNQFVKSGTTTYYTGTNAVVVNSSVQSKDILLFANWDVNNIAPHPGLKIYNAEIYNLSGIVREYIPCINPSNAVGLYDLITQAFFANAGSGSFIAGPEV